MPHTLGASFRSENLSRFGLRRPRPRDWAQSARVGIQTARLWLQCEPPIFGLNPGALRSLRHSGGVKPFPLSRPQLHQIASFSNLAIAPRNG